MINQSDKISIVINIEETKWERELDNIIPRISKIIHY